MRLINTTSGELQEFFGSSIPSYAILSHTWGDDEVLYADILNGSAASKKGYGKVSDFCQMAKRVGNLDWAWVDTCCINKESSAELSEAINSMYKWYKHSAVCYVYLQDVLVTGEQINQHIPPIWTTAYPVNRLITANFPQSRWFTRGWTLQELIAPPYVEFYAADWTEIGTKRSLAPYISDITGIPIPILHGQTPQSWNVAERLSWASKRNTTREEDMAYCLLGLFNVNMPLLYGEGTRSFIRLQEQILQQEEDYSIFTWTLEAHLGECLWGVLASSPLQFANSSRLAFHPPSFLDKFNDDWARKSIAYKALESMPQDLTEDGQDEVSLLPYQPVRLRDYKRLSQQAFHHSVSSFELIPSEPPQITSRGLRLTLPVKREEDASLPALAWIYCELDDRLLCLALHPSSGDSSAQEARYNSAWLVGVDKSILREFRLEKIFCHPAGQVGVDNQGIKSSVVSPSHDSPARLRIVLQSTAIEVVDCWPPKLLGKDEIFLYNSENRVGIVDCKCMLDDYSSDFYVCFGIFDGKPWCTIVSESKHEPEVKRESVIGIGAKYSMEYISKLSAFSDRTSMLSSQIPNMVFTTLIRKDVSVAGPHAGFILEIGLLDWLKRSLWADLSLSQAVLLPAHPQQSVIPVASPKARATKIQSPRKRNMMVEWHRILKTPGNGQEAVNIFKQIRQQARSQSERRSG